MDSRKCSGYSFSNTDSYNDCKIILIVFACHQINIFREKHVQSESGSSTSSYVLDAVHHVMGGDENRRYERLS